MMKLHRGFTLLEMIVSIAIFSIIALMASGAAVSVFGAYGNTQTGQALLDNLNFSVESMSRDIRFAKTNTTNEPNCNSDICISFVDHTGATPVTKNIEYIFMPGTSSTNGYIERAQGGGIPIRITAPDIDITHFGVSIQRELYQVGVDYSGNLVNKSQPRTTFIISGSLQKGQTSSNFSLQSTVTQLMAQLN